VYQTHGRHNDAPQEHDGRDKDRRAKAFEQDVGQGFEASVGDEEEAKCGIVLAAGHVEIFLKAIYLEVVSK
jgi:hypothetical protein